MSRVEVKRIQFGPGEPTSSIQWTLSHPELKRPDAGDPSQNGNDFNFDLKGSVPEPEIHLQTPPLADRPTNGGNWILTVSNAPEDASKPTIASKKGRTAGSEIGGIPPVVLSEIDGALISDLAYNLALTFGGFNGGMAPYDHWEQEGDVIVFYFRDEEGIPGEADLEVDLSGFADQLVTFEARFLGQDQGVEIGLLQIQYI